MSELLINFVLLLIGYIYVFAVIGAGIFFQKKMDKSTEFTRKTIHVLAGFVVFIVFFFTPTFAWFALIIAGTFVAMLWLVGPKGPEAVKAIFSAMAREDEIDEGKIYGPIYYSISITVLPASIAFSTSSFTTEAGRSTTSPAAILFDKISSNWIILPINKASLL